MKIMLLAGLYLFFVRVLWSVFSELRDPRTVVRKQAGAAKAHVQPDPAAVRGPMAESPAVHSAAPAPMAPVMMVAPKPALGQLAVIEPFALAGTMYQIGSEITLGRAGTNGIVLDDTYVSTVHARIFRTNDAYFIEDLASRNGSSLNGMALVATTALNVGDRIQLGATAMEFS